MADAVVRKWGNSLGIVLPRDLIEGRNIKEGDVVFLPDVIKVSDFSDIFGKVKTGVSGQKFKDEARRGWKEKRFS
ncbi:AbrB/MazE/SpoVT family DNA-binding domain-containing protein [Candidatus Woesearchaeota archaeon]|nr:AbrB/MazE/SpoVT family DNA-binding domain-containing protein [Candidatus Woesearchaeota archaeon]